MKQKSLSAFLGWGEMENGFKFYIRQLRDTKGGAEFDPDTVKIELLPQYCKLCAWAMANFGFAYADQTEKDHKALIAAAKSGRVKVAKAGS